MDLGSIFKRTVQFGQDKTSCSNQFEITSLIILFFLNFRLKYKLKNKELGDILWRHTCFCTILMLTKAALVKLDFIPRSASTQLDICLWYPAVEFTLLGVNYSPRYTCGQYRSSRLMHPQEFAQNTQKIIAPSQHFYDKKS